MYFKPSTQDTERLFKQELERQRDARQRFNQGIRDAHQIAQAEQQASEVIQQADGKGRIPYGGRKIKATRHRLEAEVAHVRGLIRLASEALADHK